MIRAHRLPQRFQPPESNPDMLFAPPPDISAMQEFGHGNFSDEELQDKCSFIREGMDSRGKRAAAVATEGSQDPEISVVVPAHREEKYILATLLSLMRQTHQSCEFVLVVNGEPHGCKTHQICEEAGFPVIHEPRKGIALGRDIGLRAANGRIIASTDADTIYHPGWLTTASLAFHENKRLQVAGGHVEAISLDTAQTIYKLLADAYKVFSMKKRAERRCAGPNSFFLRDLAIGVGGYNTSLRYGGDTDLFNRMLQGEKAFFIDSPLACAYTSSRRINTIPISTNLRCFLQRRGIIPGEPDIDFEKVYSRDIR